MGQDNAEAEFNRLVTEWKEATGHHSSPTIIRRHPNYGDLVAFGVQAVPWLLASLRGGDHWFELMALLGQLTGQQPDYKPDNVGGFSAWDVGAYAKAWLQWGRENGYA